jgi:hypothetical protein
MARLNQAAGVEADVLVATLANGHPLSRHSACHLKV